MDNIDFKKYLPLAYIAGGILVLIVLISWLISPKYGSFELHKTPFITENFTSFSNGKLYSYNGTAFYSVNPKDPNDITILSTGLRLPAVKKLYWAGDKGALIVFGDTQTDGSVVENELMARGKVFDVITTNYTWYLDFKTNSLHLASEAPIDSYNAYYSPSKRALYFSTLPLHHEHGAEEEHGPTLWAYSTDTFENRVAVADISSELVRHIGPCTGGGVCVIQDEKPDKQVLWGIVDGKKEKIASAYNSISPTDNPAVFIAEKNHALSTREEGDEEGGEHQHEENHDEDMELKADVFLLAINGNKERPTAVDVGVGASPAAVTYDEGKKFVLFDDTLLINNRAAYRNVAPDLFGTLQTRQEEYKLNGKDGLMEGIVGVSSYSADGAAVLAGSEGGVYLHSPSSYDFKSESYDEKTLKNVLKPCIDKYTRYYEYAPEIRQATIGVVFDGNFAATIKNFSLCIASSDKKAFVGQNYIFIGLSPIDGRFVTN